MDYGRAMIVRRKRPHHGRGCVTLDDHEVRAYAGHDAIQRFNGTSGQVGQRLAWRHQFKVDVGFQAENGQGLIQHVYVLARTAQHGLELAASPTQP
jgi:hypothetical protein